MFFRKKEPNILRGRLDNPLIDVVDVKGVNDQQGDLFKITCDIIKDVPATDIENYKDALTLISQGYEKILKINTRLDKALKKAEKDAEKTEAAEKLEKEPDFIESEPK